MRTPEQIFVKMPEKTEKQDADKLLAQEIIGDLMAFPEDIRILVKKMLFDFDHCSEEEIKKSMTTISQWWENKYGFSFDLKASRAEVLLRKYAPQTLREIHKLQFNLLHAMTTGDEEEIARLKIEYQQAYPNGLESIEAVFGIRELLIHQKKVQKNREEFERKKKSGQRVEIDRAAVMKDFRDLTEYQFLLTHFLLSHQEDRDFLERFWSVAEEIARRLQMSQDFNLLRRGQVSQVATFRIIEQLGQNPVLSHPDEDAFSAVDLWSDEETAIQIKGTNLEEPALLTSEEINFPAIATQDKEGQNLYNSQQMKQLCHKNKIFHAKIEKLEEMKHRKINGYMMIIPYSKIDFVTGEPDRAVVEFFRGQLEQTNKME